MIIPYIDEINSWDQRDERKNGIFLIKTDFYGILCCQGPRPRASETAILVVFNFSFIPRYIYCT